MHEARGLLNLLNPLACACIYATVAAAAVCLPLKLSPSWGQSARGFRGLPRRDAA